VKIKAASETTAANSAASKASPKSATRNGNGARSASVVASAAATATSPPDSLLARLGAATPEPAANHHVAADDSGPAPAAPGKSDDLSTLDPAERLARLEAEIDSLTAASIAGAARGGVESPDSPASPTAAKTTAAETRRRDIVAIPAPVPEHRAAVIDEPAGDDDDHTEVVIVTSESNAAGRTGRSTSPAAVSPRSFRGPLPTDEDDAEVEIIKPGDRHSLGRLEPRMPAKGDGSREGATTPNPPDPARWRFFRGPSR
jgi:hypothetical protein